MKSKPLPSQERLNELFSYDPETGVITWKLDTRPRIKAGDVAGTTHKSGYRVVKVNGLSYPVHRIIWKMVHGDFDETLIIDHVNRCRSDNRLVNLRLATCSQNSWNNDPKGFHYRPNEGRYISQIRVFGKLIHIGTFRTQEEARSAYLTAKAKYHIYG